MISVVMATYNGEKYIRQQLDSILNQTLEADEILICDDVSSDSTFEILKEYEKNYENIVVYQNETNLGYAQNFWNLINRAAGDYIFFSDQDDCWHHNKIKDMIDMFDKNECILALNTAYDYIDAEGEKINDYKLAHFRNSKKIQKVSFESFVKSPRYVGMAMAIRKDLLNKVKTDNIELIHAHDWCLNHTAAVNNGMYFYDTILSSYRQHGNNTFGTNAGVACKELQERRAKIIDEELLLSKILVDIYRDTNKEKYVNEHLAIISKRKKYFQNSQILKLIMQYMFKRKYLAFRGLLGDVYVIKSTRKI